jgi:hypothetical protein
MLAACAALSACAAAAAPPPAPTPLMIPPLPVDPPPARIGGSVAPPSPRQPDSLTGEAGRELARGLLATLTGIADRVVEVRRSWSGPGYYLHGFELWERPTAATRTNVCMVRVHRLPVTDLSEAARHNPDAPLNPGARAESVTSEVRFHAIGPTMALRSAASEGSASPQAHGPACAGLTSADVYFRAGESDAYQALQQFEYLQYFARTPNPAGAVTIECTTFGQPCRDPRAVLAGLDVQRISAIRSVPCEGGAAGCWEFTIQPPDEAAWTLTMHSYGRRARVTLTQVMPPVV